MINNFISNKKHLKSFKGSNVQKMHITNNMNYQNLIKDAEI